MSVKYDLVLMNNLNEEVDHIKTAETEEGRQQLIDLAKLFNKITEGHLRMDVTHFDIEDTPVGTECACACDYCNGKTEDISVCPVV